ncbi:MAG: hypothetical protein ABI414_08385 [Devosia sp.]
MPQKPSSPYFQRLLVVAEDGDYGPKELLEPHLPEREVRIVQDLILDGFEPQLHGDALTRASGFIVCEGIRHFENTGSDGRPEYSLGLLWGGAFTSPPFTAFGVDVYRDENCSVLRVEGARRQQAI